MVWTDGYRNFSTFQWLVIVQERWPGTFAMFRLLVHDKANLMAIAILSQYSVDRPRYHVYEGWSKSNETGFITPFRKHVGNQYLAPINWNLYAVNVPSLAGKRSLFTQLWPIWQHDYPSVAARHTTFMTLFSAKWKHTISFLLEVIP